MTRNSLTELYLNEIRDQKLTSADLLPTEQVPHILKAFYEGRCASRPVFLDHAEYTRLAQDMANLHAALTSIPEKLFGGDFAAFARAVGMTGPQIEWIVRSQDGVPATKFARADTYQDGDGFKILEYNMGSTIGGLESGVLARAQLASHQVLRDFAAKHNLSYTDPVYEQINSIRVECGLPADARPTVALCDWPSEYELIEEALHLSADWHTRELGIDSVAAHLGMLEYHDGRVWIGDKPIDIIYRIFMLEHLLLPEAQEIMVPLLEAAERGEVKIFTPIGCEVFGTKGALALLSDEANRHVFEPHILESLDRILPWTRVTRPGTVTVPGGGTADLVEYALANREELALKPTLLHGGKGVLLGWDTDDETWAARLAESMDGQWVLQKRVRPLLEQLPDADGELVPFVNNWGVFSVASTPDNFGGIMCRMAPESANIAVISVYASPECKFGSSMHQIAPAE
ncbi:hypothetical protein [Longispora albida]|uniref:hypothetical protein n=1 Tax=Longispora albida TaxID=203523 RepID=UPI000376A497|nr:hypothetical protein [Longispora albida]